MITPAQRIAEVKEYYFSKKLKEIAQLNAEGKNIISLGIGSPDLPPSESILNTLCEEARKSNAHGYQPYNGISELRESFASWYKKWYGVELSASNEILPLIGSKEGILHITLAFVNPGDQVLVPNPGYPTYTSLSKLLGAEVISYDLKEENGWLPDFDALEKLDLSKVRIMWMNYPNMPTGTKAKREVFEKAVAFGLKHNILIVNDNPYSFILNDDLQSILQLPEAKSCCIEMNSLSKSHNMPGWRIGMIAANPEFISWIIRVKSNIDSGMFKAMQLAAAEALKADNGWHAEMNAVYSKRREVAERIMTRLGCSFNSDQMGMFLWGKIPAQYESAEQLADRILYDARVFVTPGSIFGSNGDRYIRISLCCPSERLEEAYTRINENIK